MANYSKLIIKAILAILLLGCLLQVPYGYFQFVRIASCLGFLLLAYNKLERGKTIIGILTIGCAILLNPVFKIHFTREVWNNIDLTIAIVLAIWIMFDLANRKK